MDPKTKALLARMLVQARVDGDRELAAALAPAAAGDPEAVAGFERALRAAGALPRRPAPVAGPPADAG